MGDDFAKREAVAVAEAKRFLVKAGEWKASEVTDRLNSRSRYGSKEAAALKRSSMDLTRALAELRKP